VSTVHVVVPDSVDDPAKPSGGNTYDRRVCQGLTAKGWTVHEHLVPGAWPDPDSVARHALADVVAGLPRGALVLIDGLIGSAAATVLMPEANRLSLVVLVHMPLDNLCEGAALSSAAAVITTSSWTRDRLIDQYRLQPSDVHVAVPGVDAADVADGTADGGELLCVAAITAHKGHDVLVAALAMIGHRRWRCTCVGALDRDPHFVARLRRQIEADGLGDRISLPGPYRAAQLDQAYAGADALVLASQAETYGMVVTEALARGLPVIASAAGGLPEALGRTSDGRRPGLLVTLGDPRALAAALDSWLGSDGLRRQLRNAARERRATLPGWSATAERIAHVLTEVGAG
jgi:glycosyltransferase involved in cell wall biosynthesis